MYKHVTVYVGFHVLIAVVMKDSIFWDITSCSPLKFNRRFGGTRRFGIQDEIVSQAKSSERSADFHYILVEKAAVKVYTSRYQSLIFAKYIQLLLTLPKARTRGFTAFSPSSPVLYLFLLLIVVLHSHCCGAEPE
jgi:hypothetical protein